MSIMTLDGNGGNETLVEYFIAGFGNDRVTGNEAPNRAERQERGEVLNGGPGNDSLRGGDGDDILNGGSGNDSLRGGNGDDILHGGPGADKLWGGPGLDTASYADSPAGVTVRLHSQQAYGGDAAGDTFEDILVVFDEDSEDFIQLYFQTDIENLTGSAFDDILAGDHRDNVIAGGDGDDILYGGPGGGDDQMFGGPGNDILYGGVGNDRLVGGAGNDRLIGGPDADVYVFEPGTDLDTVIGFTGGLDKLDLAAFELESIEDLTIIAGADGVTVDLTDVGGGTILLADVTTLPDVGDFLV